MAGGVGRGNTREEIARWEKCLRGLVGVGSVLGDMSGTNVWGRLRGKYPDLDAGLQSLYV